MRFRKKVKKICENPSLNYVGTRQSFHITTQTGFFSMGAHTVAVCDVGYTKREGQNKQRHHYSGDKNVTLSKVFYQVQNERSDSNNIHDYHWDHSEP